MGVLTLGSPLYCGTHGENGREGVAVLDLGGELPLDCLDNDVRPGDGLLIMELLVTVLAVVGGVAVMADPAHMWAASCAMDAAAKGE